MAVIINNMHMPTTCTMCWISNICQEHIHDLKHIGYDRRLDDCPIQELPSAEPEYDLEGYSDRLWKAAYERGKAESERKRGKWKQIGKDMYINLENAREQYKALGYPHRNELKLRCSVCGKVTVVDESILYNFCPHCGADMRGEENDA